MHISPFSNVIDHFAQFDDNEHFGDLALIVSSMNYSFDRNSRQKSCNSIDFNLGLMCEFL